MIHKPQKATNEPQPTESRKKTPRRKTIILNSEKTTNSLKNLASCFKVNLL